MQSSHRVHLDHLRARSLPAQREPCADARSPFQHYLRLYIYAFAFQAHIQRATMNNDSDDGNGNRSSLFPAGLVASPDAKFILEAIDAAVSFVLHDWEIGRAHV